MALVFPQINNGLHHKPFFIINPNHSNPSIHSINRKHRSIICSPIQIAFCSNRRSSLVVHGLDKESDQGKLQGEEDDDNIGVKAALSMLRFYKREISPLMPNSCRYLPTCSEYSMIAYKKYGVVKGSILTAWRLCRCNPLDFSAWTKSSDWNMATQPSFSSSPQLVGKELFNNLSINNREGMFELASNQMFVGSAK